MTRYFFTILFFLAATLVRAQVSGTPEEGKVSYVTAQNIYVKFTTTTQISAGDTLFVNRDGAIVPALVVTGLSSISCVCIPLAGQTLSVGDAVISKSSRKEVTETGATPQTTVTVPAPIPADTVRRTANPASRQQTVSGNASVASYLNFSDVTANNYRMKYHLSALVQNIGNSKFSAETYMTFSHKLGDWAPMKEDIFNGLKIYSFAVNYAINNKNTLWLGRRINPRIASVGAIDGVQYEYKPGAFSFGVIAGARPDYLTYGFDFSLLQFGAYAGHDLAGKNGAMQTTLGFIDQLNGGATDRQFAYVQHTNALVRNLYFFGSAEIDLYSQTMNPVDTTVSRDTTYTSSHSPSLTNVYLSLRYRPWRKLSFTVSYSSRQNVIYYETYKSYLDRLLDEATVQGYTLQVGYQPVRNLSLGVSGGYRDSKKDPRASKNVYGYLTWSNIPGTGLAATLSATWLESGYTTGTIYSAGLSRDFFNGKLAAGIGYRHVDYRFSYGGSNLAQHMAEANLSWRIMKKLSCNFFYEGTFDPNSTFNRLYINITQRF